MPARGVSVLVTSVRDAITKDVGGSRGSSWGPVWSPDSRWLAFYSDRDGAARLWLWDVHTGALRRASDAIIHVFFEWEVPEWTSDSKRILVKLLPAGVTLSQSRALAGDSPPPIPTRSSNAPGVTAKVFTSAATAPGTSTSAEFDHSPSFFNASSADLAFITASSGVVERVVRAARVMSHHISPDGSRIAFSTRQPDDGRGGVSWGLYDLWVVDKSGDNQRLLVPHVPHSFWPGFSWSASGRFIAVAPADSGVLVVDPTAGAAPRRVGAPRNFGSDFRAPLWMGDSAIATLSGDTLWRIRVTDASAVPVASGIGQRWSIALPITAERTSSSGLLGMLFLDRTTRRMGLQRIDLRTGATEVQFEDAVQITDIPPQLGSTPSGDAIAFVMESSTHPADVWVVEGTAAPRRVSDLNPLITRHALGSSRLITWRGANGEKLGGALLLPTGYREGHRYPLIVQVYGGSRLSNEVNAFGLVWTERFEQLLATRGYAVLEPDTPLRVGTPLTDLASTVLPGVEQVIDMGIADSSRIGLMGHSYGGYSALALLVQSHRFKAAVISGGFSNLFAQYTALREDGVSIGWTQGERGGQLRTDGTAWEVRDRYIDNSPFFKLDRVSAAVLLLHGGADQTVFPEQAASTYSALRRLGKTVTYVRYDGEDHYPGTWSTANLTDYWNRIFDWFARHLGSSAPK